MKSDTQGQELEWGSTTGSKPARSTNEQGASTCGCRHFLGNRGVKLAEGSGTCFQFLIVRCTITTRTVITGKFFSLLSLWFQEHTYPSEHSSTTEVPKPRLSCLLHCPPPRPTCPLSSPGLHELPDKSRLPAEPELGTQPSFQAPAACAPGRQTHSPHTRLPHTKLLSRVSHIGTNCQRKKFHTFSLSSTTSATL